MDERRDGAWMIMGKDEPKRALLQVVGVHVTAVAIGGEAKRRGARMLGGQRGLTATLGVQEVERGEDA